MPARLSRVFSRPSSVPVSDIQKLNDFNQLNPLADQGTHPHIDFVQPLRGCTSHRSGPRGRTIRISLNGGYAMRTFDLAPLYRSTVGFDRLFSMPTLGRRAPGHPPHNIERTGENAYRSSVAVAGFGEHELSIEAKENTLTIKGEKQVKDETNRGEGLYQALAARA